MKKIISLILALVMIMGLAVSASAASITITSPTVPEGATETGITYAAYKIFDATIIKDAEGNITSSAYTIENTSPYYETVNDSGYFTLTKAAGSTTTYVVTAKDTYTSDVANTFADTLKAVSATAAGTLTKQSDGTYKLDNLADGYYLVTSSVGSDLILDTIGDITVATKNEYPTLTKEVDKATADKGATLTFTLKINIPEDAVGEIVVHDTMTNVNSSLNLVNGITQINCDNCNAGFKLSADYVKENKGKEITITYTGIFNADDIATNEAYLVDDTFTSKKEKVETLTTDIVINKVISGTTTPLENAKFVLKNEDGKFYSVDATTDAVSWVDKQDVATEVTTNAQGSAEFSNVANGTYYLVETEAPAGYNLLTAPVKVEVTAVKNTEGTAVADIPAQVENSTGSALPSTGGMGTTLFYVIGGLMMAGAAVLLVTKKRMA